MGNLFNRHFVSIIIPALNEETYIGKCLTSLKNLAFQKEQYEIILVDNGSKDKTVEIAKQFGICILTKLNGTIGALRNYGAKHTRGNIIAFIDADCQVHRNWLKEALKHFDNPQIAAVGSRLDHLASTWVSKCWSLMHSKKIVNGETDWLPSGNMIVLKKYFDEINGFDEQLTTSEDYDLCLRLRLRGYKIISDPKISSLHLDPPKTLIEFYKKEIWHGQEMLKTFLKSPLHLPRSLIYATFYLFCTLTILIGIIINLKEGIYSILFISSIAFLLVPLILAIITSFRRRSYKHVFQLTLMYMVYGIARAASLIRIW